MNAGPNRFAVALVCLAIAAVMVGATACRQQDSDVPATSGSTDVSKVTVAQVEEWMNDGTPIAFVDSRSGSSWESATTKAPGAIRVPPHDVEPHLGSIPRGRTVVVYCT